MRKKARLAGRFGRPNLCVLTTISFAGRLSLKREWRSVEHLGQPRIAEYFGRPRTMSDIVWLSRALADTSIIFFFDSDLATVDVAMAVEGSKRNPLGEALGPEYFPKSLRASDDTVPERLPDLFVANGYWVISNKAAYVLRQFDLGNGALYPVAVLKHDGTPYPGEYFSWNFGNLKTALSTERSTNLRPFGVAGRIWNLPWVLKDDDVAVTAEALAGPDVWADPTLFKSLFISDRLGSALNDARLAKAFKLYQSRVV